MPIQTASAKGVQGLVELKPEYAQGLQDLDGLSDVVLIYYFHKSRTSKLVVKPFLDDQPRGVFAIRAPQRPNPIGLSIVRLTGVEGTTLHIENVNILDGTPLLDTKSYIPHFDNYPATSLGWLEHAENRMGIIKSDQRFVDD